MADQWEKPPAGDGPIEDGPMGDGPGADDPVAENLAEDGPLGEIDVPQLTGVLAQPWSCRKLVGMMTMFGPAAVVASLGIGAGETIVVVCAGSWSEYDLLWLVLLACLTKGIFLTYLLGRYTAVSGEFIGHRLVHLPGPRGWLLILVIVLELAVAPFAWAAIAKPCGVLFCFLLQNTSVDPSGCENMMTVIFIAGACSFGMLLSYEQLEKQQLAICAILVGGTTLGTMMVRPDFWAALIGTFNIGHIPEKLPAWTPEDARRFVPLTIATIFSYVGGSVMTYIVYSNWVGAHGWGLNSHHRIDAIRRRASEQPKIDYLPDDPGQVRRMRKLLAPLCWDVSMGATVLFIVTASFLLAGAAVLYPMLQRGEIDAVFEGWSLLTDQAHVWSRIHPALVWVYYVCVVVALWGTLQALPEVYSRVTHEFLEAIWPRRKWNHGRMRALICGYLLVSSTVVICAELEFETMVQIAGFISANFAVALMMFAALYLNYKLPRAYRAGWPMLVGGVVSAIVLAVFSTISGWGLAVKFLGAASSL